MIDGDDLAAIEFRERGNLIGLRIRHFFEAKRILDGRSNYLVLQKRGDARSFGVVLAEETQSGDHAIERRRLPHKFYGELIRVVAGGKNFHRAIQFKADLIVQQIGHFDHDALTLPRLCLQSYILNQQLIAV